MFCFQLTNLSHFILFYFISFSASSPSTSSPVKHTCPLVAVLKSSHFCSFFSFVADEDLRGRNVLLLTSFSRYVNCSDTPEKMLYSTVYTYSQYNSKYLPTPPVCQCLLSLGFCSLYTFHFRTVHATFEWMLSPGSGMKTPVTPMTVSLSFPLSGRPGVK